MQSRSGLFLFFLKHLAAVAVAKKLPEDVNFSVNNHQVTTRALSRAYMRLYALLELLAAVVF